MSTKADLVTFTKRRAPAFRSSGAPRAWCELAAQAEWHLRDLGGSLNTLDESMVAELCDRLGKERSAALKALGLLKVAEQNRKGSE